MSQTALERGLGGGLEAILNQKGHLENDFGHLGRPEANEGAQPRPKTRQDGPKRPEDETKMAPQMTPRWPKDGTKMLYRKYKKPIGLFSIFSGF